eukprot:4170569-Pyramimonas_sp.AAC.1
MPAGQPRGCHPGCARDKTASPLAELPALGTNSQRRKRPRPRPQGCRAHRALRSHRPLRPRRALARASGGRRCQPGRPPAASCTWWQGASLPTENTRSGAHAKPTTASRPRSPLRWRRKGRFASPVIAAGSRLPNACKTATPRSCRIHPRLD